MTLAQLEDLVEREIVATDGGAPSLTSRFRLA
jgi:hypothetical protein